MNILELAILKKMVGGGGSGTDNYNDLSNLPQINGETLAGNKTAENLGLQDALTFDSAPTEDSTNPVESGGVYNALAGKQDNLTFDGVYNASTNKAATESTVTNAIAGLDVSAFSVDADETISSISETDGKINVTKQDIAIASNQVTAMTGYTKPSSAPATPAIQTSDTANQAFGKLEFKADTNQTNILYAANRTGKNVLRIQELYDVGYSITIKGITYTVQDDYSVKVNGTCTAVTGDSSTFGITQSDADDTYGQNINGFILSGCPNLSSNIYMAIEARVAPYTTYAIDTGSGSTIDTIPAGMGIICFIRVPSGKTINNAVVYPMIRPAFTDDTYQPPSLSNYDLTRLEAEDRAALAEEIDAGAKNGFTDKMTASTNMTASNGVYTASSTDSRTSFYWRFYSVNNGTLVSLIEEGLIHSNGIYTIEFTKTSAFNQLRFGHNGAAVDIYANFDVSNLENGVTYIFRYNLTQYNPANTLSYRDIMVCTKAAFGVSQKFVPYRPDMYDYQWQAISTYLLARRSGRTITINGYIANISFTANTATLIGNVNTTVGRPHESVRTLCNVGANAYTVGTLGYLILQQDGNIYVTTAYEGTGAVYVSLSYTI